MKTLILVGSAVLLFFFSAHPAEAKILSGLSADEKPVFLSEPSEIPRAIKKFERTRDLTTEEGKIDYIFSRIRNSQLKFVRNGIETGSEAAVEFLRWKIGWYEDKYHTKIKTLHDFISKVTRGSEKTGKPYVLIYPDGTQHNMQFVLQNEERQLEALLS